VARAAGGAHAAPVTDESTPSAAAPTPRPTTGDAPLSAAPAGGPGAPAAPDGAAVPDGPAAPVHDGAPVPDPVADLVTRPHRLVEDVVALLIGSLALSFGLMLLKDVGGVSGGIAGIAFLVNYSTGWPFGLVFFLINLPFYALAIVRMGWPFTIKTFAVVGLISVLTSFHAANITIEHITPFYACALGGMFMGLAFLALFRHGASAGGLGIFVFYLQDRFGVSAGVVQLCFDAVIVLCALFVADVPTVLASVLGVVVLNVILAMNHRPGRYRA